MPVTPIRCNGLNYAIDQAGQLPEYLAGWSADKLLCRGESAYMEEKAYRENPVTSFLEIDNFLR